MSFEQAVKLGYAGRIECRRYLDWIKTLACDTCNAPPPSDPSHLDNDSKGMGTKKPDLWSIPQCRRCHDLYERMPGAMDTITFKSRCSLYLLRAYYEGVLTIKRDRTPEEVRRGVAILKRLTSKRIPAYELPADSFLQEAVEEILQ